MNGKDGPSPGGRRLRALGRIGLEFSLIVAGVLVVVPAAAQEYDGFTAEEVRAFHERILREGMAERGSWGDFGDLTRYIWLNMSEVWPHSVVSRGETVRELPSAPREDVAAFATTTSLGTLPLAEFVRAGNVDGAIVVSGGEVVFEAYPRMRPSDKHFYASVSKTLVATAVAVLEGRGRIDVAAAIDAYLPELAGSAWEGIRVLDILDMASGIDCLVDFDFPEGNCFQESWKVYGWPGDEGARRKPLEYFAMLESRRPPGEVFEYADINPLVLTLLIERVSGRTYADFLEEVIWQPMGAEADALMLRAAYGRAASPLGMSSTLRDLARFGILFTPSGLEGEHAVLTRAFVGRLQREGRPELFTEETNIQDFFGDGSVRHNTYQWDHVTHEGDLYKCGFGGQGLYVSPSRDVVVAFFSTVVNVNGYCGEMPIVARQLVESGLFRTGG